MAEFCGTNWNPCTGGTAAENAACRNARNVSTAQCFDRNYGPAVSAGGGGSFVAIRPQSASFQANLQNPAFVSNLSRLLDYIGANQPRELFPGAVSLANLVVGIGATLTGFGAAYGVATQLAENVERRQSGMALNLSGILGAAGSVLSGANLGQYSAFGQLAGGALQIAGGAFAPSASPTYVSGPVYNPLPPYQPQPSYPQPQARPTMSMVPALPGVASGIRALIAPILAKIAASLGKRGITLSGAVAVAKKLSKFFVSPEAIALYLGITVAELGQLLTAHAAKKRRRMNPANSHALRRAARRIKSFHRLCTHTDLIKSRSRSRSAPCGTCRKRPCRC